MPYEKALQEFRQVKHLITETVHYDLGHVERIIGHYYKVQQKWRVEDTSRIQYSPAFNGPPDSKADVFLGMIAERPMWQPLKEVWRDLPEVSAEEAKQDSQ